MTIRPKRLSVVIPCFNAERWLSLAIESVLIQQCDWVEVIVVNDGSSDRTKEIIDSYGSGIVPVHQRNSGVSLARKRGVQEAQGDYIKFLDADDAVPPGALAALKKFMDQFSGDVLIGSAQEISESSEVCGDQMYKLSHNANHLSALKREFLLTQATHTSLWAIPRSIFLEHELFCKAPLLLGEEYDFCMRMIASNAQIRHIDLVVSWIRVHCGEGRLSNTRDEGRHLRQVEAIESVADFVSKHLPDHEPLALKLMATMAWSHGRHCLRMGIDSAAERYFRAAIRIDPCVRPSGSYIYQALCRLMGPFVSERLLIKAKGVAARFGLRT